MFKNYLKIGIRNLLRNRFHSFVNIAGLAAGVTCCLFIVLYIADELSFDRYHQNAGRIYRVTLDNWAKMPPALAPAFKATYPHISHEAVRLWPLFSPAKVRSDDVVFVETGGVFADPEVFSVFSWPMVSGNPKTALTSSNAIVLTKTMATKYFGNEDAVGRSVEFWGTTMTISGVIHDIPANSHLQFDFLVSFPTLYQIFGNDLNENWEVRDFYTYVLAGPTASSEDIRIGAERLLASRGATDRRPVVQPITGIHLHSRLEGDLVPGGNVSYLYTLASAAIIVLLLACINFANLTTARAATRTKEVGIRKVMGARRRQLVGQFFGEALILSLTAFLAAIILVSAGLPAFNRLAGKDIQLDDLSGSVILPGLFIIMLLIGLLAGAYPALFLSRFKPVNVLKGWSHLPASNLFVRKGLIVFQFAISTMFLAGMTIVIFQLNYLQKVDLGYDEEQVLVLDGDNFPQVASALKQVAGVEHVAGIPQLFGGPLPMSPYRSESAHVDSLTQIRHYGVTTEFVETLGIELIAGRRFSESSAAAEGDGFIVNESALQLFGWDSPDDAIGRSLSIFVPPVNGGPDAWRDGVIIGVVKDFNYEPLYRHVQPLVLYPGQDLNLALVRVNSLRSGLLASVKAVWNKVNPDAPFNYFFLKDQLQHQYESEKKLGDFMAVATGLAVMIACLGLFALVTFSAAQRIREIGIRKVLGATVGQIVALLSLDFLKLVCIGVIAGLPVVYVFMRQWLSGFAYHISLSWWIFAGVGVLAILIAVITIGYQSLRAAQADPADSIRYE